jgi:DNA-binding beta-propeller fold protein YncE
MGVGPDGAIWLVGRETNVISKFSTEGRKLLVIGSFSARAGDNSDHYAFNRPAALAHDSDGNVYIADGYINTRVAKYGPSGDYIAHWGGKGDAHGQFNLVHGITVDHRDRIYVADRGNKRIQVFDADGKFLDLWEGFGTPWALAFDKRDQTIWMCDGDAGRVFHFALDGKILGSFGSDGPAPGQLHQSHGIAVDSQGAVYVAETVNQRIQKFVLKK